MPPANKNFICGKWSWHDFVIDPAYAMIAFTTTMYSSSCHSDGLLTYRYNEQKTSGFNCCRFIYLIGLFVCGWSSHNQKITIICLLCITNYKYTLLYLYNLFYWNYRFVSCKKSINHLRSDSSKEAIIINILCSIAKT